MKRAALAGALLLAGCASVLAALGPTHGITFDSGYQVWLYQVPRGAGRYAEFVILFRPDGAVSKTGQREPRESDINAAKLP